MNIKQLITEWVANPDQELDSGNVITRGTMLFSYAMLIAHYKEGKFHLVNRGPSITTNKHIVWVRNRVPKDLQVVVESL